MSQAIGTGTIGRERSDRNGKGLDRTGQGSMGWLIACIACIDSCAWLVDVQGQATLAGLMQAIV